MSAEKHKPLVAIDVGNSQIMAAIFPTNTHGFEDDRLAQPQRTIALQSHDWDPMELGLWLAPDRPADVDWFIGSVCDEASAALQSWLTQEKPRPTVHLLDFNDLPLTIEIPAPAAVGIDRLLGAVAANRIRPSDRPAIVIDLGSAITVDVISAAGNFCGGAILPGIQMSCRALHAFTDRLPEIALTPGPPPSPMGRSTHEAICSGIYWGTVGALRVLLDELQAEMSSEPIIIVTGGNAGLVADRLEVEVRCEPNLILSGIAIVVESLRATDRGG